MAPKKRKALEVASTPVAGWRTPLAIRSTRKSLFSPTLKSSKKTRKRPKNDTTSLHAGGPEYGSAILEAEAQDKIALMGTVFTRDGTCINLAGEKEVDHASGLLEDEGMTEEERAHRCLQMPLRAPLLRRMRPGVDFQEALNLMDAGIKEGNRELVGEVIHNAFFGSAALLTRVAEADPFDYNTIYLLLRNPGEPDWTLEEKVEATAAHKAKLLRLFPGALAKAGEPSNLNLHEPAEAELPADGALYALPADKLGNMANGALTDWAVKLGVPSSTALSVQNLGRTHLLNLVKQAQKDQGLKPKPAQEKPAQHSTPSKVQRIMELFSCTEEKAKLTLAIAKSKGDHASTSANVAGHGAAPLAAADEPAEVSTGDDSPDDESWERLKFITPNPATKVQLPSPQQFTGAIDKIVPVHYNKLELYVEHLCKLALRGRFPLAEVVADYFKGHASAWADTFFKRTITTQYKVSQAAVADYKENKQVFKAFKAAFLKHFGPQLRCERDEALEILQAGAYMMQPKEKVALYHARFAIIALKAELTTNLQGWYFRKGLPTQLARKCLTDEKGRMIENIDDVLQRALDAERALLAEQHDKAAPLSAAFVQGQNPGRGGGRGGRGSSGRGGRGGRSGGQGGRGTGRSQPQYMSAGYQHPPPAQQQYTQYQQPHPYGQPFGQQQQFAPHQQWAPQGKFRGRSSGRGRGVFRRRGGRGRDRGNNRKSFYFVEEVEDMQSGNPPEPPPLMLTEGTSHTGPPVNQHLMFAQQPGPGHAQPSGPPAQQGAPMHPAYGFGQAGPSMQTYYRG